jgi:hypothetical protein
MVAQSVKIVVLASMVMAAKNAKLGSIACLPRIILRHVSNVVLGDTNQTMGKQAVFRVRQESTASWKVFQNVVIVQLDEHLPWLLATRTATLALRDATNQRMGRRPV